MQSILTSSFSSTPVSITGLSLMLQPDTDYFVVARGNVFNAQSGFNFPGFLNWGSVPTTTHTGDGFVSGGWASGDSGSSWFSESGTFKMSILAANSVPEIDPGTGSSALSVVAGVLAMIEQRRRRATLVA